MTPTHGIHTIDTGFVRPRFDAAYLVVENGRGAFIDCGTNFSVPRLLAALDEARIPAAAVDWLILTHVHLDHAGGAGELIARLPNAKLVVHPRGARHMIDPSVLWAGASGLVLLILVVLQGAAPARLTAALALLVLAALGGFFLASFHLRKQVAPKAVVLVHAGVAVAGFLTLLSLLLA